MFPGTLHDGWSGNGETSELRGAANTPLNASAEVRDHLVEALRLDLIGPDPRDEAHQHERLPHAPSRWYLTGFLAPTGAPDGQRAQDAEEELDEPSEPTQGGDDASAPERGSSKRVFLPSSMGLSALVDAAAKRLRIALSWGDYVPEEDTASDAVDVSEEPGGEVSAGTARRRFAPWVRRPRSTTLDIDLDSVQAERRFGSMWRKAAVLSLFASFGRPKYGEWSVTWTPALFPCSSSIEGRRLRMTMCRIRPLRSRSR